MALIETYRPGAEGEDTFVDSTAPATRNGDRDYLEVGRVGSAEARAFLKFDVPLKPGWSVTNAILRTQVVDFMAGVDPTTSVIQAHRVGAPWDEGTLTWNDQPAVSGAAAASVSVGGPGTYTFGVATAVEAWQAGQANRGLRLAYAAGQGNWAVFASSDHADPNARPYLEIIWQALAPNAPIVRVSGFPANETSQVSWRFSHDDPSAQQTAYAVEILDASDGTPMFTVSKTAGSSQSLAIPANTLVNGEEYQIRVKTWGPEDVEGPWSAFELFSTTERPVLTLTGPTSGQVVTTSAYDASWIYGGPSAQTQYRVRLYEQPSNALVLDSGIVNSALSTHPLTGLKDNTSYRIEVEVWNEAGVGLLAPAAVSFSVDTVPPATPMVEATADIEAGVVRLAITNPAPGVGEVPTASNEVWRRAPGEDWTRVGSGIAPGSTFQDPTAASGIAYEYRVVAVSTVATTAEVTVPVEMVLFGVWLHVPSDPLGTLIHLPYDGALGRMEQWTPEVELLRFAGRGAAVAEFGPSVSAEFVDVSVQLPSGEDDRQQLEELAKRRTVVCYRDGQRRKVYGVISNLAIRDQSYGGSADFRVDRVDHIETGV